MDSKERSCDCETCAMDPSEVTDEAFMCSKSCYPESEFAELFRKLRTCKGPGIHSRMTVVPGDGPGLTIVDHPYKKVYAKK